MEKGLELAFMGKQFSLEDGVLSRENYGQVVLPDVKKEEPLSQATVEQMRYRPPNKEHQREVPREEGGGGGGGDNAAQTTPTRLRRGAKPKDEQTDDNNNGFANIAAKPQELSQHPLCTRTTKPDVVQRKRNFAS